MPIGSLLMIFFEMMAISWGGSGLKSRGIGAEMVSRIMFVCLCIDNDNDNCSWMRNTQLLQMVFYFASLCLNENAMLFLAKCACTNEEYSFQDDCEMNKLRSWFPLLERLPML